MRTIRKLTPDLLKRIIAEEKEKIMLENEKEFESIKKMKLSKEVLFELAYIHKEQKKAIAKFKKLHERKELIKKAIKNKR